MKYLIVIVAVVALGWFGFTRYLATLKAAAEKNAAVALVPLPVKPAPAVAARAPSTATPPPPSTPAPAAPVLAARPVPRVPDPKAPIPIDLAQALGANNHFHDDAVGLVRRGMSCFSPPADSRT